MLRTHVFTLPLVAAALASTVALARGGGDSGGMTPQRCLLD